MTKYATHRNYHHVRPNEKVHDKAMSHHAGQKMFPNLQRSLKQLLIYSNGETIQSILFLEISILFYCYLTRDVGTTMLVLSQ